MTPGSERARIAEVLAERARAYARPHVAAAAPALDAVAFGWGDARYAIDALFVQRIERIGRVAPLPGAPPHFTGLMNLHGQLIPLIDLGRLSGTPPCAHAVFAVLVGNERPEVGIVTETILGLQSGDARPIDAAALLADPRLTIGAAAPPTRQEPPR